MHSQPGACSEVATVRKHLSFTFESVVSDFPVAGVAELADALDSKSSGRKAVWVRAPPPALPRKRISRGFLDPQSSCELPLLADGS